MEIIVTINETNGLVVTPTNETNGLVVTPTTTTVSSSNSLIATPFTLGLVIGEDVQAWDPILDGTTASFLVDDETKLDGIEALADVTDTANVDEYRLYYCGYVLRSR